MYTEKKKKRRVGFHNNMIAKKVFSCFSTHTETKDSNIAIQTMYSTQLQIFNIMQFYIWKAFVRNPH